MSRCEECRYDIGHSDDCPNAYRSSADVRRAAIAECVAALEATVPNAVVAERYKISDWARGMLDAIEIVRELDHE